MSQDPRFPPVELDKPALRQTIGAAIKTHRVALLPTTLSELAARAAITPQAWHRLERGTSFPSLPTLYRLAKLIDLAIDPILRAHVDPPRAPARAKRAKRK